MPYYHDGDNLSMSFLIYIRLQSLIRIINVIARRRATKQSHNYQKITQKRDWLTPVFGCRARLKPDSQRQIVSFYMSQND